MKTITKSFGGVVLAALTPTDPLPVVGERSLSVMRPTTAS
jgi:hypothetical protein